MITLALRLDAEGWRSSIEALEPVCQRALDAAAAIGGRDGEVSVLLCDDEAMQVLNRDWRGKDTPTDVLSFEAGPEDAPFLGDIAIGHGVATRDAATRGLGLDQHLSHLLIHGYLHLIGHDHMEDTEAREMEAMEIAALASLGWPDPYS